MNPHPLILKQTSQGLWHLWAADEDGGLVRIADVYDYRTFMRSWMRAPTGRLSVFAHPQAD